MFIILKIFFATGAILKVTEYHLDFPYFSIGIFSHVTRLDLIVQRVLARANLNSKNGELTTTDDTRAFKKHFKSGMRFIVILNSMSRERKILFVLVTVFWIGSTDIEGQVINSSWACNGTKNCETCVRDSSCFWCETQLSCQVYGVKSKDELTKVCGEWRWKSCEKTDASIPLVAIISGCASVVLICGECSILLVYGLNPGVSVVRIV